MTWKIILTRQAERDIESTADWWAVHRSAEQAGRWYVGLSDAIQGLGHDPERCALATENDDFPYELRQLNFGLSGRPTHRVLFTIIRDLVVILTVRHSARRGLTPNDIESDPTLR